MYWRMGWDSNPRYPCGHAGFQDRCLKPLGHPSKLSITLVFFVAIASIRGLPYRSCDRPSSAAALGTHFSAPKAASILAAASSCIVAVTWRYRSSVMLIVGCSRGSCATFRVHAGEQEVRRVPVAQIMRPDCQATVKTGPLATLRTGPPR